MKETTTSEFTVKEAKVLAYALDMARRIVNLEEDDRPDGVKYISSDKAQIIKDLSYKFYSSQVSGATITQVTDTED